MMEEWKGIKGFGGFYEVSNLGRVRSVDRTFITNNCHGGRTPRTLKGKLLQPIDNGNGYYYVNLKCDGHRKNCYIHRLVAEAFCDNPNKCKEVNHKDFDKHNNRSENLEWCERKYNVDYSAHKMRKCKSICKQSNTGVKYISLQTRKGRSPFYRVQIRQLGISKRFKTLAEAEAFLKGVMENGV